MGSVQLLSIYNGYKNILLKFGTFHIDISVICTRIFN